MEASRESGADSTSRLPPAKSLKISIPACTIGPTVSSADSNRTVLSKEPSALPQRYLTESRGAMNQSRSAPPDCPISHVPLFGRRDRAVRNSASHDSCDFA